jgi:hypothetical protein
MTSLITVDMLVQTINEQMMTKLRLNASPVLALLEKKVTPSTNITFGVNTSTGGAAALALTANSPITTQDTIKRGTIPVPTSAYRDGGSFTGQDISIAAYEGGIPALQDLVQESMTDAMDRIIISISQALYAGDPLAGSAVFGLADIANQTPATPYAGLTAALYPRWVSPNENGAAAALTGSMFDSLSAKLFTAGGNFTHISMSPNNINKYKNLFTTVITNQSNFEPLKADIGFTNYAYQGRPIVRDQHAPNSTIYFLNLGSASSVKLQSGRSATGKAIDLIGMTAYIDEVAQGNAQAFQYDISLIPQFSCKDRRCVATITNFI